VGIGTGLYTVVALAYHCPIYRWIQVVYIVDILNNKAPKDPYPILIW